MSDGDKDRTKDAASLGPAHSDEAQGWKANGRRFESALALLSLSKLTECIKLHGYIVNTNFRAQEPYGSQGGRPGRPVPNSPYGLSGHKATLNLNLSSCDFLNWSIFTCSSALSLSGSSYPKLSVVVCWTRLQGPGQPLEGFIVYASTETVRTVRDGEPRTPTSTFTQLLSSVKVVQVNTETVRTVRDREPMTSTSTFSHSFWTVIVKASETNPTRSLSYKKKGGPKKRKGALGGSPQKEGTYCGTVTFYAAGGCDGCLADDKVVPSPWPWPPAPCLSGTRGLIHCRQALLFHRRTSGYKGQQCRWTGPAVIPPHETGSACFARFSGAEPPSATGMLVPRQIDTEDVAMPGCRDGVGGVGGGGERASRLFHKERRAEEWDPPLTLGASLFPIYLIAVGSRSGSE